MSPSPSRTPLLAGLAVVLALFAGVVAFTAEAAVDEDEVFPAPGPAAPVLVPAANRDLDKQSAEPKDNVRIELTLTTLAQALPPRPPPVQCELARSDGRNTVGTFVAGVAATSLARTLRGQQLVRFPLAGGRDYYRVVRLLPGSTGVLALKRGTSTRAVGMVVDADGRPLADARVWLAGAGATTDAEGHFELDPVPVASGLPFVVSKPGYAARFRILNRRLLDELSFRPVTLHPGATLRFRFLGPCKTKPRVYVLPVGGRDSRLLEYPFFMQAIAPVAVGSDGAAVFDTLPAGVEVRVCVVHPDYQPAFTAAIRLRREGAAAIIHGVRCPAVRGKVLDPSGCPVAGACVTSRPGDTGLRLEDTGWFLPPEAYVRAAAVRYTSADGAFAIPMVRDADGRTLLTVEAPSSTGLEYTLVVANAADERTIVLFPAREFAAPRLMLEAAPDLGGFASLRLHDDAGAHGPYSWRIDDPFEIRVARRGLVGLTVSIDDGEPRTLESILVTGTSVLSIRR